MIKDLLKGVQLEECEGVHFSQIKSFVTHKPRRKVSTRTPQTVPFYKERSLGSFDVEMLKDEGLKKIAQQIREIIRSHA